RLERLAEHAFFHRAHLGERRVASAVLDGGTRFDSMHFDASEREIQEQLRRLSEDAGPPESGGDDEPELGAEKPRLLLPELEDATRLVFSRRGHRKADVGAGGALAVTPRDEPLEGL